MKGLYRIIVLILAVAFILSGCDYETATKYILPDTFSNADSCLIDENKNFILSWDEDEKCVLLKNKDTGYTWSTTPYDLYEAGRTSYSMSSSVAIDYYDPTDNSIQTEKAVDCIDEGTVSSSIKNKKLGVTYYFKNPEITVKLYYYLAKDSLKIELNSNDLYESGKTRLINVSVAPYLCSVVNSSDKNNYIFVPSGSGAIMYTDQESRNVIRNYSQEVYGYDYARAKLDNPGEDAIVRLPCFGVTAGNDALFAIIEGESGAAQINAVAGDSDTEHSTVYTTFNIRGYNNVEWAIGDYHGIAVANDVAMLNELIPKNRVFSVGYYPLSGENADYNGMADCYKEYLKKSDLLKKSDAQQKECLLTLIGAAKTKSFFCGIPYYKLLPLTTFKQANEICKAVSDKGSKSLAVQLKGYGSSGLDVGQIAGGFEIAKELGGKKGHKAFEDFCKSSDISLYTDFNIVTYVKSGNGFNTFFNSAQTANAETVSHYSKKKNIRTDDTDSVKRKFLARDSVEKAVKKLTSFSKSGFSGISLSTYGSTAYSDYGDEKYMLKGNLSEQARQTVDTLKKSGHNVFLSSANAYIAGISDGIADAPLQNGGYDYLDEEVPFYELVYKGNVPLYSTPLNLSENPENLLLKAVATGVSPSFILSYTTNQALTDNDDTLYYATAYKGNMELVEDTLKDTGKLFKKIKNTQIKSYIMLDKNITKTVFDNGVTVFVNRSQSAYTAEGVEIAPMSFVYK